VSVSVCLWAGRMCSVQSRGGVASLGRGRASVCVSVCLWGGRASACVCLCALQGHHEAQHKSLWDYHRYLGASGNGVIQIPRFPTQRSNASRGDQSGTCEEALPSQGSNITRSWRPALTCPYCGRQFTAQIGLFAHLTWKHQQQ